MNIKDIVLVSLLTVLYFLISMVLTVITSFLGPFAQTINPGICGLLTGSIIYFMNRKIGKFGEYIIMNLIIMCIFLLIGGGNLIWVVSVILASIIADILTMKKGVNVFKLAIANGILIVGQTLGGILPAIFYLDKFRNHAIRMGRAPELIDKYIAYISGPYAISNILINFVLGFIGIYMARAILKKHIKE